MNEQYRHMWELADGFIKAKINPDAQGGEKAQLEQLYGNARLVFTSFAEQLHDATPYAFINLIRKVRGDE